VTLDGPNSVLGRAMVIYEREDDFDQVEHPATHDREGRYRTGMGRPIGCCVIGLVEAGEEEEEPVEMPETKPHTSSHFDFGYGNNYGGYGNYGGYW